MEKVTFLENPPSRAKPDAMLRAASAWASASASAPGDASDLSQQNFFQSADLGQFPGPSSRAPSRTSSFGSMDSGVSHPPRQRGKGKKLARMKYSDLTRRASDTHLSQTLISDANGNTAHSAADYNQFPDAIELAGMKYSDLTRRASDTHLSQTLISDLNGNTAYSAADFNRFPDAFELPHPKRQKNTMCMPSQGPFQFPYPEVFQPDWPPPPWSHGLFRMLQSNFDPDALYQHDSDFSDPPNLYESLQGKHSCPPPEDMHPSDPDLVPRQQELRFKGDLYTPGWVRGFGNKREGWCGICKPGRWLVLKNSAFWYDKSFTHGVSAATGSPFQEPKETRRMDGNPDVWEGLCDACGDWIALVRSKKKGTTWFRHAYKCHTHKRMTDSPNVSMPSGSVREDTLVPSLTSPSTGTTTAAGKGSCSPPSFS